MTEQDLCQTEQTCEVPPEVQSQPVFRPRVDIVDSADAITLYADLPGVDENSLDITLEKETLTLKGEVGKPGLDEMTPILSEYRIGRFERSFSISEDIERDAIDAVVTQGVLKLTLPKSKHAKTVKVAVKAG